MPANEIASVQQRLGSIACLGIIVLLLGGCAGAKDPADATTTSGTVLSVLEFETLVRKSAEETRPVQSVLCATFSDDLTLCAVTFRGPSCELWNVENGNPKRLGVVIEGASGSRSGKGVRCGK